MLTLPTCSDGWNRGVAHCTKVWGPCYLSPLSGRDSLVPLELACKGDIQPVTPDVTLNLITWNILIYCTKYTIYMKYTDILYQIYHIFQSCTRQSVPNILIYCTKYTIYFKAVLDNLYQIYWYRSTYQIYHIYEIYWYTVPNIPYISKLYWTICTKYTIYFKAVLDNLYQIYHIYCTKYTIYTVPNIPYTVPNNPYISKLY